MTGVSLYPVPKTFDQAYANAQALAKPKDSVTRYMNDDLSLTTQKLKEMDIVPKLKQLNALYFDSWNPHKLTQYKEIIAIISKMALMPAPAWKAISENMTILQEDRVAQIPYQLKWLRHFQRYIPAVARFVECGAAACLARRNVDNCDRVKQVVENNSDGSNKYVTVFLPPSK